MKRGASNHLTPPCNCPLFPISVDCNASLPGREWKEWAQLGLLPVLRPQEHTQLIGSTADINPCTQCNLKYMVPITALSCSNIVLY